MHLLKTQRPIFSSILDDLVLNNRSGYTSHSNPVDTPSVNVIESDVDYRLQLVAPGKNKEDFTIELDEGVLSIATENEIPENNKEENYTLREFVFNNFKRAFKLPDTVAIDEIKAEYKSGILTVTLPKVKEALPQPKKLIAIK
ncbi:Hsp20/alpha crystallin family protein [Flavobacteriaceae bacterium]|nr:Hsp20/alpha crystallin family protein [Flavobacteriaceae bacterium]